MKVRIGLNYKGIGFEQVKVDTRDRGAVVDLSTQSLTPVIRHGESVLFDSGAILRYLDANWPETPRLFSADRKTHREIERWEHFGRGELYEPVKVAFAELFKDEPDVGALAQATRGMHRLTERIEERLGETDCLVGDAITAADVTTAPLVSFWMISAAIAAKSRTAAFFREHLVLDDGRDRTRAWVARLMEYNHGPRN